MQDSVHLSWQVSDEQLIVQLRADNSDFTAGEVRELCLVQLLQSRGGALGLHVDGEGVPNTCTRGALLSRSRNCVRRKNETCSPLVLAWIARVFRKPDGVHLVPKLLAECQQLGVGSLPRNLGDEDLRTNSDRS